MLLRPVQNSSAQDLLYTRSPPPPAPLPASSVKYVHVHFNIKAIILEKLAVSLLQTWTLRLLKAG